MKALDQFKDTSFILADPSVDMLNIAKTKLAGNDRIKFIGSGSLELDLPGESIDILTAVMIKGDLVDKAIRWKYDIKNRWG